VIESVYLFDARALRERGVKAGTASSVRAEYWRAAEIYPTAVNTMLMVTDEQRALLELFRHEDRDGAVIAAADVTHRAGR
jgi:hypothetical protein